MQGGPRVGGGAPIGPAPIPRSVLWRTAAACDEKVRAVARALHGALTPRERQRAAVLGLVFAAATVTALVRTLSGSLDALDEVAQLIAGAVAGSTCAVAARRKSGRAKIAWIVLAGGAALWGAGRLSWMIQDDVGGASPDVLSAGDLGILGATICFIAGILLLVDGPVRRITQLRALIEGLMIGSCTLFVSWMLVFRSTFEVAAGMAPIQQTLVLVQPLLHVAAIAVVVSATTRVTSERARWWAPLAAGIGTIVISEVTFAHVTASGTDNGLLQPDGGGILIGFAAIAFAATRSWTPEPPSAVMGRGQTIMSAVPSLSALGVLVGAAAQGATGGELDPALVWIALGVLCLSVVLHLVVVVESDELSTELSTAHDQAIQASLTKSQFLATVSHEIRTPMNAVIGLTGLLLDSELDAEQQELAVGVAISAEGLLGLINDVLDFSKIEADKMDLEEIDLDLEDLVGEVAMIVAESAHRKGLEVVAYCDPALHTRRKGDPLRIRQILLNLASNAVKFTHEGSVVIRAVPGGSDPSLVAFEVVDTGVGIAENDRVRLFEPFSQADESTTRTFGGTGLGLAIVKRLTDLQRGDIAVESEVGTGTVFRVTLPLSIGLHTKVEAGLASLTGLRALVVDGDAVTRTVLAHTLHTWGFIVDQAATAEEALELYGWSEVPTSTYAVALIEYQLEGMDGVRLAEVLRAQGPTSETVMLLLSSDPNVSRQAAHDAGIESVLVKPVRNSYLLRRIVDTLVTDHSAAPVGALPKGNT